MNDPNDYSGDGGGMPRDPTAGLDRTVRIAAPQPPQMWAPPAPIQYTQQTVGIPNYVYQTGPIMPTYDDSQSYMTGARASYGDLPMMGARGAYTVGAGAMLGAGNMFSAIGAQIAPISYTPPARVLTDYSGRYVQQTDMGSDLRNMLGFGTMMRAAHVSDIRYNAAADFGEKIALGAAGAGLSMANIGIGIAGSMAGGAAFGGIGALVGGLAAPIAASALVGDRIEQGVAQRRDIMNYLEATSDRYISAGNPLADPRRGAGFSATGRREVTEFIRGMDIKDPMLNTEELTKILKESTQQGLFTGTHTMDDFKKRFKDVVDNVKVVATTLHQTLEEGIKTIHDLRAIGIDPSRVAGVVRGAEAAGFASGRSAGEMLNLGLQGAEMFRGTGVAMQIGFESNIMHAAAIRSARDAKMLSDEAIAQAGGEEALAQRMTASSLGFVQSGTGRGMMGMVFGGGMPGTGFNADAFNQMVSGGGGNFNANAMNAARNLSTPGALIKFQANQEQIATEMGKTFGGKGMDIFMDNAIMMQATNLARIGGGSVEDSFLTIAKTQMGLSDTEARARLAEIRSAGQNFSASQAGVEVSRAKAMEDQAAQNFFTARIGARIGAAVKTATDVVSRPIADMVEGSKQGLVGLGERLSGEQRVNLNGTGYDLFIGDAPAEGQRAARAVDIDFGGLLNDNAGQALAKLIRSGKTDFLNLGRRQTNGAGANVILERGGLLSDQMAVSSGDLTAAVRTARIFSGTLADAESAAGSGAIKGELAQVHAANLAQLSGPGVRTATTIDALARAVFSKDADKLTQSEFQALQVEFKHDDRVTRVIEDARSGATAVTSAVNAASVAQEAGNLAAAKVAGDAFSKSVMGITALTGDAKADIPLPVLARLARVREAARAGGDTSAAESAFREAMNDVGGPDRNAMLDQTDRMVRVAKNITGASHKQGDLLDVVASNFREISAEQVRRGTEILSSAVQRDVFAPENLSKTSEDEKRRIIDSVEKVGKGGAQAVLSLGEEELDLLKKKTRTGAVIAQEAEALQKIAALGKDATPTRIAESIKSTVGPEMAENISKIVSGSSPGADRRQVAEDAVHAALQDSIAGKSNVGMAGATSATTTAGGTADQQATTQMNINLQILQAMTALSSKLKG